MAVTGGKNGVGVAVHALRKAAGMTLAELSQVAGVSGPYVSNVENGNVDPSPQWVHMVIEHLGSRIAERLVA